MALISTVNTKGVALKMKEDLNKYLKIFSFISNIFFLAYYTFVLIRDSKENIILIIINSLLLLSVVVGFIFQFIVKFKTKKGRKTFNHSFKPIKYLIRFASIVYNVVAHFVMSLSDLHLILTLVSLVIFGLQILFEFVVKFISRYISEFQEAIAKDYEESNFIGKGLLNKTGLGGLIRKRENEQIEIKK